MKDLCRGLSMLCSQTGKRVSNFIFRDPRLLKEKLFLYVFSTLKLCHSINQPRQDGKKHQGDLIMKIGRLDLSRRHSFLQCFVLAYLSGIC